MGYGHVRIQKINPTLPRGSQVVEELEYVPGKGNPPFSPPYQAKVKSVGGSHLLRNLNNQFVRITENIGSYTLKTGETVKQARIEYWIEELGQWYKKKDIHTFFPQSWDSKKIQQVVSEAAQNIIEFDRQWFHGITKDGIEIEFYIDEATKEIRTAYIHIK